MTKSSLGINTILPLLQDKGSTFNMQTHLIQLNMKRTTDLLLMSVTSLRTYQRIGLHATQPANIGPQDVPRTSPSNVPRTFPKDPIWPSRGRLNLTS